MMDASSSGDDTSARWLLQAKQRLQSQPHAPLEVSPWSTPLPRVGTVLVSGVTGSQARKVNGHYFGVGIDYNGRELLRKKEDPDIWLR